MWAIDPAGRESLAEKQGKYPGEHQYRVRHEWIYMKYAETPLKKGCSERIKGNGSNIREGRFRLGIKKKFLLG